MSLSVHIIDPPGDAAVALLRRALDAGIRLTSGAVIADGADYDVLVEGRPERDHLLASPRLRTVIVPWAGIPAETRRLLADFPHIALHNLHFPAIPVAEGTLALLLAAAKRIVPADQGLREGDWTARYTEQQSVLFYHKTALILGYGAIGQRVARMCQAMEMRVIAMRHSTTRVQQIDGVEVHPPSALHDLLPQAAALIITLPLTPETEGLIGARELALLPPCAVLVNVGRGPIVDETALYHALKDRTLGAAGIDVWYTYPEDETARAHTFPSKYPFHELNNVVMSPHRTGHVDESERLQAEELAHVLNAIAQGRDVPNRVDLQAGY